MHRAAEPGRVLDVQVVEGLEIDQVGVRRVLPLVGHRAAGRLRAGLEAVEHPLLERLELAHLGRPDVPDRPGLGRDHVRGVAGVGEDAVDALVGLDVLAQRGDVHVAEDGGVEGVAALVGRGGGVGGLALVAHVALLDRDRVHAAQVGTRRVDHHRRVDALEGALLGHEDLAAAPFLGRRAQDQHPPARLLGERGGGQPGPEPGGADDVVAAGVADDRQGVVLAQHRDRRARTTRPGPRTRS